MSNAVFITGSETPQCIQSFWQRHARMIGMVAVFAFLAFTLSACGGFSTDPMAGEMSLPEAITPNVGATGAIHNLNGNLMWE